MPRPTNKDELIALSEKNFGKLVALVNSFPEKKQLAEFPLGTLNRNMRDVLAHLHHWHLMLLKWYEVGMSGHKPDMPAKGHSWKTVPKLNQEIQKKYCHTELSEAKRILEASYKDVRKIILKHTNDELFEKKKYPWTGSTSLGAYLISATSSHYEWGVKLIKKVTK